MPTDRTLDRRPIGPIARLVLALLLGLASVGALPAPGAGAQAATDSIGIRLLDSPTARADDPRARQYIVDHLAPGTTIERRIEISNTTTLDQDVDLYPAAAEVGTSGFTFGEDRAENELTSWTSIDRKTLPVAAGATGEATVTIAVPADASAGERYAVIWAQPPASTGSGIQSINRVGIRIYLSVGEGGEPASDFTIDEVTASRDADGVPSVTASVHNTGGRALDISGQLSLADGPGATSAGPFPTASSATLAIGDTEPVTIELDPKTPDGPWTATLELRSGTTVREATATITFPKAGGADRPVEVEAAGDDGTSWLFPVIGLVVVLVLVAGGSIVVARRRRDARTESY